MVPVFDPRSIINSLSVPCTSIAVRNPMTVIRYYCYFKITNCSEWILECAGAILIAYCVIIIYTSTSTRTLGTGDGKIIWLHFTQNKYWVSSIFHAFLQGQEVGQTRVMLTLFVSSLTLFHKNQTRISSANSPV